MTSMEPKKAKRGGIRSNFMRSTSKLCDVAKKHSIKAKGGLLILEETFSRPLLDFFVFSHKGNERSTCAVKIYKKTFNV